MSRWLCAIVLYALVSLTLGLVTTSFKGRAAPSLKLRGGSDPFSQPPPSSSGPPAAADWSSPPSTTGGFAPANQGYTQPPPVSAQSTFSAPPMAAPKFNPPPGSMPSAAQKAPPKFMGPPAAAPASAVKWDQSSSNSGILGRSVTIINHQAAPKIHCGILGRLSGIIGWDLLDWIVAFAVGVGLAQLHAWWHGSFTEVVDMAGGA